MSSLAHAEGTEPEPHRTVRLMVNGTAHEISVADRRLLSDALRHDIGLTGTHVGCEHGVCGACTIQVDGKPMRSCHLAISGPPPCTTTSRACCESAARTSARASSAGPSCSSAPPTLIRVMDDIWPSLQ